MFAVTREGGMAFGFPDVCKTPPFAIPIPYPNMAMFPMANPTAMKVFIMGMQAVTKESIVPITMGDQPGAMGGVKSQVFMADAKFIEGSAKVKIEGSPAERLFMPTNHNNENIPGLVLAPSQTKVMIMS